MSTPDQRVAVVTGASSGIGAAVARRLSGEGFTLFLGARRADLLAQVAEETGGTALPLDVRDAAAVGRFLAEVEERAGRIDVLVNNAGLAFGLQPIEVTDDFDWELMWETNVLGLLRITRGAIPLLRRAPHAHIVNLGSVAGRETYWGGAGYAASKHAVHAISQTLRQELNGEPIRITELLPGMVETEFSVVRFKGDAERAAQVYEGVTPLTADDIADCIVFAVTRPPHVDIDEMVIRPVAQAQWGMVSRRPR